MQKRCSKEIYLHAEWIRDQMAEYLSYSYDRRSWLFYYFVNTFSKNILIVNSNTTQQSIEEYFTDYEFDETDTNIYSTNIIVNKQEIKITIWSKSKIYFDVLGFIC